MMRMIGYALILVIIIVTVTQVIVFAPRLPDPVASHFGSDGEPDSTMSKTGFLTLYLGVQAALMLIMLGAGKLCGILPTSMINLPNRAYWLSQDRKPQTIRFIDTMTVWMAVMTGLFMAVMFQMTFQANISNHKAISNTWFTILLSFYLAGLGGTVIAMIIRFVRVPKPA